MADNIEHQNLISQPNIELKERFAPLTPLRSVDLSALTNLIRLLDRNGPLNYTNLFKLFSQPELVGKKDGKPYSNSTFYHHLAAARILELIEQNNLSKNYFLTSEKGRPFAQVIKESRGSDVISDEELNEAESDYLKKLIINNEILNDSFFWLFRGVNHKLPLERGVPLKITLLEDPAPKYNKDGKRLKTQYRQIESKFCPSLRLDTNETQSIVFGVRQWCLKLGILDELVTPAKSITIPEWAVQILYPIKNEMNSIKKPPSFEQAFLSYFWKSATHLANYWSVSVPELLYNLCPGENIKVEDAKHWLTTWLKENRAYTISTVFSPSTTMHAWTRRKGDYEALLKGYLHSENGYISHIGILDYALSRKRFPLPDVNSALNQ